MDLRSISFVAFGEVRPTRRVLSRLTLAAGSVTARVRPMPPQVTMGLVGIGVDVLHTPRILALMRRRSPEQLARRILSQTEWKEWRQKVHSRDLPAQATWLAVRYVSM